VNEGRGRKEKRGKGDVNGQEHREGANFEEPDATSARLVFVVSARHLVAGAAGSSVWVSGNQAAGIVIFAISGR